ncbi:MAG: SDR family oxidoreductase [Actinoallomurus sp.]
MLHPSAKDGRARSSSDRSWTVLIRRSDAAFKAASQVMLFMPVANRACRANDSPRPDASPRTAISGPSSGDAIPGKGQNVGGYEGRVVSPSPSRTSQGEPGAMTSRRVLITGASRGIGHALAARLAGAGHHPVGLARTAPPDFPGEFHTVDLADRAATGHAAAAVLADGPVDALVNNVGLVRPALVPDVDLDDLQEVYDLTVRVAVQLTQAVLPGMATRRWGRIVNVSSLVTVGMPERTSYGAAKAALDFCTRAWAGELATTGITVNSVAPGPTETELFRQNNPPGSAGEARYLAHVPAGRFAQPAELAAAICFLLSEDAGYITGQTLRVDGGASVG